MTVEEFNRKDYTAKQLALLMETPEYQKLNEARKGRGVAAWNWQKQAQPLCDSFMDVLLTEAEDEITDEGTMQNEMPLVDSCTSSSASCSPSSTNSNGETDHDYSISSQEL
eukprot:GHVT01044306.1.p2 GENE.GHVT01044306.1~~GHVT01044306.1.p2  ORF type:complete len:111 (-),score=29.52 GHVT01044306.1:185-517(-)